MKKLLIIISALALEFALCACGGSGSSSASPDETTVETTKSPFVGSWVMESYESTYQPPDGSQIDVTLEITSAKKFTYNEKQVVEGASTEITKTGSYYESGNNITFTYDHTVASQQGSTGESDGKGVFTGVLEGKKLKVSFYSDVTSTLTFKRA